MARSKSQKSGCIFKGLIIFVVGVLLLPAAEVAAVRFIDPPWTMPMLIRQVRLKFSKAQNSALLYEWIDLRRIPVMFLKHLWIAEDQRFFEHDGFDWKEMDIAIKEAERKRKPARGASTITMQCARSLFLWQGRSWLRKGLESYYTVLMELLLSKQRIMELYANAIEMGDGIYGVEAASKRYFEIPAKSLTREQSAMLAAVLPNPVGWNPVKPSPALLHRQQRILQREKTARFPANLLR